VGNGSYYGGGYYSLPNALVDDGLLDVILVKKIPVWKLPPILARYKAGTHFAQDGSVAEDLKDILLSLTTKEIKIRCAREFYYTLDGECTPTREVEIRILPGAARFILPYTTKK
jgi:diacylglycerol kinase family enzyme